ncbi:MAG: EF-P lysine aminoacylase EpmA [bacterium]
MVSPRWKQLADDRKLRERLTARSEIVFGIRQFFRQLGFAEVETPTVVPHPGMEPNLDPFETEVIGQGGERYCAGLITSPEYALKKLLAAGYGRVFEITRCYRNREPWGGRHNPEFAMIEWYRSGADYCAIMEDTERLVGTLAVALHGKSKVEWRGNQIDLSAPWERLTVAEAFRRSTDIDLDEMVDDPEGFRKSVRAAGYETADDDSVDDLFFRVFLRDVEPNLGFGRPVFLCDYPRQMASLSRLKPSDPRYAERFEAYACGMELCNAFSELNDPAEQRRRLEEERQARIDAGKIAFPIDDDFVEAVGHMPDSAGIALGIDRLVMLLTDAGSIEDVTYFPAAGLFGGPSEKP